jgi:hypothetical protein
LRDLLSSGVLASNRWMKRLLHGAAVAIREQDARLNENVVASSRSRGNELHVTAIRVRRHAVEKPGQQWPGFALGQARQQGKAIRHPGEKRSDAGRRSLRF